jgi:hypothetical protein
VVVLTRDADMSGPGGVKSTVAPMNRTVDFESNLS